MPDTKRVLNSNALLKMVIDEIANAANQNPYSQLTLEAGNKREIAYYDTEVSGDNPSGRPENVKTITDKNFNSKRYD